DEAGRQARLTQTLEDRSAAYAVAALDDLGWRPRAGERVDADMLGQQLGVLPRHRQVFARVLQMATDARARQIGPPAPRRSDDPELELLDRCGAALARVLRGDCDPLQLIFPNGDMARAARLYSDGVSFKAMNRLIARVIGEAIGAADASGLRM